MLSCNNVNDAFRTVVSSIDNGSIETIRTTSRVGDVLQVSYPFLLTYRNPLQRVLFNNIRDSNPFFHLFESLWMLAGRNNVAPLAYYSSNVAKVASDDGKTFNGAYGYRWRHPSGIAMTYHDAVNEKDQLPIIIDQLKRKPDSRRAVLSMWNVDDDLLKIDVTKDVCCNTHAYFLLRKAADGYVLDMTVCNRSNDLIWGMLGANVVHFSFLQEYLAAHIGVGVGHYHQFTNNLHVYTARWEPKAWLGDMTPDYYTEAPPLPTFPLVQDPARFDLELPIFVNDYLGESKLLTDVRCQEPFLAKVAWSAACAFRAHKARDYKAALYWLGEIEAGDWRVVCTNWIQKRRADWELKKEGANPYLINELERRGIKTGLEAE